MIPSRSHLATSNKLFSAKLHWSDWLSILEDDLRVTGLVLLLTISMLLIGRENLGEAVVAMLYLALIVWATVRWGQWPGVCTAVMAFLTFNFFFIPPFYTFSVARLEGWLLLAIFLTVAVVMVGRIQTVLTRAAAREREAQRLYELSAALIGQNTPETIGRIAATQLQQLFQATRVEVALFPSGLVVATPESDPLSRPPERVLPLFPGRALTGEIRVWPGEIALPPVESQFLRTFAAQVALALRHAVPDLA
jgi:K+-sensing histidine kinase KdpD